MHSTPSSRNIANNNNSVVVYPDNNEKEKKLWEEKKEDAKLDARSNSPTLADLILKSKSRSTTKLTRLPEPIRQLLMSHPAVLGAEAVARKVMGSFEDASHDFAHVVRVLGFALEIFLAELLPQEELFVRVNLEGEMVKGIDQAKKQPVDLDIDNRALLLLRRTPQSNKLEDPRDVLPILDKKPKLEDDINNIKAAELDVEKLALQVIITALLHDVDDHKYKSSSQQRDEVLPSLQASVWDLLDENSVAAIVQTIPKISYSWQKNNVGFQSTLLLDIVSDADKLDAIGAVGIARCFTFGASRKRSLDSSRAHFDEKLLSLHTFLRTNKARQLAQSKQRILVDFCAEYDA